MTQQNKIHKQQFSKNRCRAFNGTIRPAENMKLHDDMIRRLLNGEHLSSENRRKLGIDSSTVLKYEDLILALASILKTTDSFPERDGGENISCYIYEGITIRRLSPDLFVCLCQRASPSDPSVLAERCEKRFSTAEAAADFFLKWDLCLPGRLDGIEVK
jgi:hypothetical protein